MGNKILGTDIAGIVNAALGPILLPAMLIKVSRGAYTAGQLTSGPAVTETAYACRAIEKVYSQALIDGVHILASDRQILILGDSIAGGQSPAPGDKVTIGGRTFRITPDGVTSDPDRATYVCHGRARP